MLTIERNRGFGDDALYKIDLLHYITLAYDCASSSSSVDCATSRGVVGVPAGARCMVEYAALPPETRQQNIGG